MLVSGETGVSSYAAALVMATRMIGSRTFVLNDNDHGRAKRWMAAFARGSAQIPVSRDRCNVLTGDNLFRAAQVRFGMFGRFTTLRADIPAGIMHWTYPVPLRMAGWVNIYTVHDVVPLDWPDLTPVNPARLRAILLQIAGNDDHVVTVSETSRARFLRHIDIDPARVVNCYQAIAPSGEPRDVSVPVLEPGSYFLFCGLTEPRKNIVRLIQAHAESGTSRPLVLAGPPTSRYDRQINAVINAAMASGQVRRLGYVSDNLMDLLQRNARALLFPSLGEGFGLPVIESMRHGTPVLTSGSGALAEIAGNAALLIDPTDVAAIANGIARLDRDPTLRDALTVAGRHRAERFSAGRFAARLRRVYSNAWAARQGDQRTGTTSADRG
jgi:glycosyltransferase involved in cell wall biosynthesis